jgi:hypothetical protein
MFVLQLAVYCAMRKLLRRIAAHSRVWVCVGGLMTFPREAHHPRLDRHSRLSHFDAPPQPDRCVEASVAQIWTREITPIKVDTVLNPVAPHHESVTRGMHDALQVL